MEYGSFQHGFRDGLGDNSGLELQRHIREEHIRGPTNTLDTVVIRVDELEEIA